MITIRETAFDLMWNRLCRLDSLPLWRLSRVWWQREQSINMFSTSRCFSSAWPLLWLTPFGNRIQLRAEEISATVGVFHPVILLPSRVLPDLGEQDLSAVLAHEYGHIRRRDFPVHFLCELISLPVAWHPGIHYLMSKISQTRELACDDYAAVRLGKRRLYARTLLRLASLCLHTPRGNAVGLGIFDGENLETRIMMLTEKRLSLSRAGLIGLALATSITFGAGAVLARAMSLQAGSESSNTAEKFAGTWHWMFTTGFLTMILVQDERINCQLIRNSRCAESLRRTNAG